MHEPHLHRALLLIVGRAVMTVLEKVTLQAGRAGMWGQPGVARRYEGCRLWQKHRVSVK